MWWDMKTQSLQGRVTVVMGAASGVGRVVARQLARAGASVVVSGGPRADLDALVREIRDAGGKAIAVEADPGVFAHISMVAEAAERELGGLHTWIQIVGATVDAPFERLTAAELRHVITSDVVAQAYAALAAVPVMRRRGGGGQFIHVSAPEGEALLPTHPAYAAAKQGVKALLDSLRVVFARQVSATAAGGAVEISNVTALSEDPARIARAVLSVARVPRHNLVVRDQPRWSWVSRLAQGVRGLAHAARRIRLPRLRSGSAA